MITKHFFKILIIFTIMIILGLGGIILVGHYKEGIDKNVLNNAKTIAK